MIAVGSCKGLPEWYSFVGGAGMLRGQHQRPPLKNRVRTHEALGRQVAEANDVASVQHRLLRRCPAAFSSSAQEAKDCLNMSQSVQSGMLRVGECCTGVIQCVCACARLAQ